MKDYPEDQASPVTLHYLFPGRRQDSRRVSKRWKKHKRVNFQIKQKIDEFDDIIIGNLLLWQHNFENLIDSEIYYLMINLSWTCGENPSILDAKTFRDWSSLREAPPFSKHISSKIKIGLQNFFGIVKCLLVVFKPLPAFEVHKLSKENVKKFVHFWKPNYDLADDHISAYKLIYFIFVLGKRVRGLINILSVNVNIQLDC